MTLSLPGPQLNETAAVSCPRSKYPTWLPRDRHARSRSVDRSIVIQAPEMIEGPLARWTLKRAARTRGNEFPFTLCSPRLRTFAEETDEILGSQRLHRETERFSTRDTCGVSFFLRFYVSFGIEFCSRTKERLTIRNWIQLGTLIN